MEEKKNQAEAQVEKEEKKTKKSSSKKKENQELKALKEEVAELKDKNLRLFAEFDNFRKRSVKEKLDLIKTAEKDLMIDLLPILDDFERAAKQIEESQDVISLQEGVSLIHNKLTTALINRGLKEMESIGEDFDPELHEAISELESKGKRGKVIDEIEKGYFIQDFILRYAKVVVGK